MIESLYWFECITVESPLCSDLKSIRQYIFFWNIFLNRGVFRTQKSILRWKPTQHFVKIVNQFQPLIIFAKSSMLDVWLGSEYATVICHFLQRLSSVSPGIHCNQFFQLRHSIYFTNIYRTSFVCLFFIITFHNQFSHVFFSFWQVVSV